MSLVVELLLTAIAPATEEPPRFRDPPACWDGAQNELNACAVMEYRKADALMNVQWKRTEALMRRLDADSPPNPNLGQSSNYQALLNGQRAWLQFRDAHCPIFGTGGGSMKPMLEYLCLRNITRERTEQLKGLMLNPATGNAYYEDQ